MSLAGQPQPRHDLQPSDGLNCCSSNDPRPRVIAAQVRRLALACFPSQMRCWRRAEMGMSAREDKSLREACRQAHQPGSPSTARRAYFSARSADTASSPLVARRCPAKCTPARAIESLADRYVRPCSGTRSCKRALEHRVRTIPQPPGDHGHQAPPPLPLPEQRCVLVRRRNSPGSIERFGSHNQVANNISSTQPCAERAHSASKQTWTNKTQPSTYLHRQ